MGKEKLNLPGSKDPECHSVGCPAVLGMPTPLLCLPEELADAVIPQLRAAPVCEQSGSQTEAFDEFLFPFTNFSASDSEHDHGHLPQNHGRS